MTDYKFSTGKGLSGAVVRTISGKKQEPEWLLQYRLKGLAIFNQRPMPQWGADLNQINFNELTYYVDPTEKKPSRTWADVPEAIKATFDKIGIPEAEKKFLAGVESQYDSEMIYGSLKNDLSKKGVIFCSMDEAVKLYPELVKKYMNTVIPIGDNKFSALNSAVWSGGSFVYVPKGVKLDQPLQAYFRINTAQFGQFERTLIIAEEGSSMHYSEGCFVAGSRIVTENDYMPIEMIKPGMKVFTHKGRLRAVKNIQKRNYSGRLVEIEFYGDSTTKLIVTEEHPFYIVKREKQRDRNKIFRKIWTKAAHLKIKDYLVMPRRGEVKASDSHFYEVKKKGENINAEVFSSADFFRLAGYYLAEGSSQDRGYLVFSFGVHEKELIADAKQLIYKVFPQVKKIYESVHKINNGLSLIVSSVILARIFADFGRGAANKKIPRWMMVESLEKQRELIRGYFRGDGNYYHQQTKSGDKEIFRMNTVSETLAFQIRDLLVRLGIPAFINRRSRVKEGRQAMFTVGISGEYMIQFGRLVGKEVKQTVHNHRRASMFGMDGDYIYLPIKNIRIKKVKNIPVYNFSVTGDESYLVEGISVHNCTAPAYTESSLHAAVVEIFVKPRARVQYTTVQNWYKNVYNLVTKRAWVETRGEMIWTDANLGSRVTMKYPSFILAGEGARGETLSIAMANSGQHQDVGSKAIHLAPNTKSLIVSKSVSLNGGRSSYRGRVQINKGAKGSRSKVICDALILDPKSRTDTYPNNRIWENEASLEHEATVSKVGEEQLFYLMSRGLSEEQARALVVNGFVEPVVKKLPLEFAVEMNRLIELEMEGSVG